MRTELINLTDGEIEQLLREVEADDGPLLRELLVNADGLQIGGRRWSDVPEAELDAAMERMMAPLVKQQGERAERERECRESFQRHYGRSLDAASSDCKTLHLRGREDAGAASFIEKRRAEE